MEHGGYLHEEVQHEREVDVHYQEIPEYKGDNTYGHDIHEHDDVGEVRETSAGGGKL